MSDLLELVDWRRRVGDLYRLRGPEALNEFRRRRDDLFLTHRQSPIASQREHFAGLRYFPPDPEFRVSAGLVADPDPAIIEIDTGGPDGVISYERAGTLQFELLGQHCALTVLSLVAYGRGLFVPFRDRTSGRETYGGGRYLFDTAKDTDGLCLEIDPASDEVIIDFNYAYNPSCAYSPEWACPLAPPENLLTLAVRAGEMSYP